MSNLRVIYLCSARSWAATLAEPTEMPVCPAGSVMLVADPGLPWTSIVGSIIGLRKKLLSDTLELNGLEDRSSVRSAA